MKNNNRITPIARHLEEIAQKTGINRTIIYQDYIIKLEEQTQFGLGYDFDIANNEILNEMKRHYGNLEYEE